MPLCPLVRCLLPLLAHTADDAVNPFKHMPFTSPTFREILMLAPLATDDPEEDMHSDILVDIEGEGDQIVDAAQGLVLDNVKLGQLKVPVASKLSPEVLLLANSFYRDWLWPKIKEYRAAGQDTNYALDRIDLPKVRKGAPDMTGSDGGFSCYRIVMQTLMNREGGVIREAVPEFCRTPAPAAGLLRFLAILALALALARQLPEPVPEFRQVQELARIAGLLLPAMVKGHHIQVCYSSLDAHGKGLSNDMLHTL
ncbi:hypothetical protein RhiJN_08745 [Ceratobasidium sp. AG-Ba]|nr:hypothetical protein RhiJN_08745 [Ceratobasidium sp. AG-Ba]